jgi:tRNA-specific 2-thiouridylase
LPVAEKKDSQGICFLGKVKVPEFLSNFIDDQPGEIITPGGQVLGSHRGLHRYTLGQRRGIGVPSNQDHENYVVTGKDEKNNQLIVAFENPDEPTLWARSYLIESLSFMDSQNLTESKRMLGKTRYRDPSVPLELIPREDEFWEVVFDEPQRALTPGQTLALYEGERLVGSASYAKASHGRASLSA